MGSELNVKVTKQELEFRLKNYREIRGIQQRQLSCSSCGNVLSQESGRIFSHPILSILQCENCKNHFKTITFNLEKDDSVRFCHICGRERESSYGCKKSGCPYEFCKSCIKRNTPKSLVDAESGNWQCFACNTQPLWKLRGACAAVMNSLPKRTKTKKVKSRNRQSSDSEDNGKDLKNISFVKRNRLEEIKKLKDRLRNVCDEEESPETKPKLTHAGINTIGTRDHDNSATKTVAKTTRIDTTLQSRRKFVTSSSDSSDFDEIQIVKPKTILKSKSERNKHSSKYSRDSKQQNSRNSESHARKKVVNLDSECSSDDDNHFESKKLINHSRSVSKSHGDSTKNKRRNHKSNSSSHERSLARRETTNDRSKQSSRDKMTGTRKNTVTKKASLRKIKESSELSSESESLSEDSHHSAKVKSAGKMPTLVTKGKSGEDKKSIKSTRRKEISENEAKNLRSKSKEDSKSSNNISSKTSRRKSTSRDTVEKDIISKKSSIQSPGPKSFKEGKKPRKETSSDTNKDSDSSVKTRSVSNIKNRKSRKNSENVEDHNFAKSTVNRHLKNNKEARDSSSEKDFIKSKLIRRTFVALKRVAIIDEDHTTIANENSENETVVITKDQTFALKNSVNSFFADMKDAATKLLKDIDHAQTTYCRKESMHVEEANRMIIETTNIVKRFREIADRSDTKVTENYDKWCKKTRIKNVLRKTSIDGGKPSGTKATKETEEPREKIIRKKLSSVDDDKSKSPKETVANGENVVISEFDSEEIFSGDETMKSANKSNAVESAKNVKESSVDRVSDESSDETTIAGKTVNVAVSPENKMMEIESKAQSPTMSEFSGHSDIDPRPADNDGTLHATTVPFEVEKDDEDDEIMSQSTKDMFDTSIEANAIEASDSDTEEKERKNDRKQSSKESLKTRKSREKSKAIISSSDGESDDSKKGKELPTSRHSSPQNRSHVSSEHSESEESATEISVKVPADDTEKIIKEIVNSRKNDSEKITEKVDDEDTAVAVESENAIEKEDLVIERKTRSGSESGKSSFDIASASTECMSYSPRKLSDENDEPEDDRPTTPVSNDARAVDEKSDNEKESIEKQSKERKKIDSARLSDSLSRSSLDTSVPDEIQSTDKKVSRKSSDINDSNVSTDGSEALNNKAKAALLASSTSDDSSSDDRESTAQSTPRDSNDAPLTPPESDSRSDKNLIDKESSVERENLDKMRKKRSKIRLNENRYYKNDELLRRKCEVPIERLEESVLRKSRYSRALRKSRDYVESQKLKRLVNLNDLDKDRITASPDHSEDEDKTTSKDLKKKKTLKQKEETLLDHLEKVKNGENVQSNSESDAESSSASDKAETKNTSNDRLLAQSNSMAKKRLLASSDSATDGEPVSDAKDSSKEEKPKKDKKIVKKQNKDKSSEDEQKKEESKEKSRWRKNKVLTSKISDTDSEDEKKKYNASQEKLKAKKMQSDSDEAESPKKKKQRVRRRVLHSDSDDQVSSEKSSTDSDSDSSTNKKKKTKKNKKGDDSEEEEKEKEKKKTRKRTRRGRHSSNSSGSDERPKPSRRKRIKTAGSDSDSENDNDSSQESPGKSGRKNIRKVLRDKQVADDTKQAAKEEEERLKRIAERQKLYNEMYEVRLAGEAKVEKLVLDFHEETKEPLVSVEESLVKKLKPHQAQGIKFMWDACFESLERAKTTKGSGCILAHCMGLGKTFQVVTLAHTVLSHSETGVRTVLVVCPLSTVLNWTNEFKIWLEHLEDVDEIEVYEMTKMKKNFERKYQLARWQETGGVMIIGYEMFRNLTQQTTNKKVRKNIQETFLKCLIDPGPDLIVCDEGHLLKNEDTALSKAMRRVKTLRRVVLTGTPLQNNLIEYHCMVQFVKPNLLGTKKEFSNRFENPITNGAFDNSTEYDVKLMKKRAHILHKLLEGSVQRFDYSVLTPFLPPKQEYVIFVKLSDLQIKMYQHYLDNYARRHRGVGGSLFADFQALQRIWTHPMVMQMNAEKVERANEKKREDETDSEGSLKDFIDDGSDTPETSNSSDEGSDDVKAKPKSKRGTRANPAVEEPVEEVPEATEDAATTADDSQWWTQYVKEEDYEDITRSSKLLILFRILKECEQIGDKLLVFSQSLYSLTLIERFLELIDSTTQKGKELDTLDGLSGSWTLGLDYFRLDGQTSTDNRRRCCDIFNRPTNSRARLFLISTRAGGLGINLTAANRVVIFDASWNPSHDVQSIFRIYRFGQKKPCYVYRLLAAGTMEEKIYNRQVTKLSLSCRVVDEQQIERHYSNNALSELYKLELPSETENTLNLPKDRLIADIFLKYKHVVENYHEHDSLLENQAGEELDEEERKQAWLEYEDEKKGKRVMPPMPFNPYQDQLLMQQINMMGMGQQNVMNNPAMLADYQNLQRLMEKDYPGIPETQQKIMASRAVYEMYNYVEKQAMAGQGLPLNLLNLGMQQGVSNNRMAQAPNPAQTYMDILRMQQQQKQALLMQQQNGQIKYASNQQQLRADILRQQQLQQQQYAQQAQIHGQSSVTPAITIEDDDVMEVGSSPEKNPASSAPADSSKNKEE